MADWQADINTALRAIIRNLLQMPDGTVRPANQNAPTGKLTNSDGSPDQWASVLLGSFADEGWDNRTIVPIVNDPDGKVTETIEGQRHLVATIQIFRGDALNKAHRLKALLESSTGTQLMRDASLGLIKVNPVLNVTQFVDTYGEERAQVEVEFYATTSETVTLSTYNKFPVTTGIDNLENPSNEVIETP